MTKFAFMQTAAAGMPSTAASAATVFAGARTIREAYMVTWPVATGHVSVASSAADAYLAWDNRQAKSAKRIRPPRGMTP
ncbi:MAG TPA: hypothetical protein VGL26_01255 [Jatrophihabitans sp.]|jgi:hypothetical protein